MPAMPPAPIIAMLTLLFGEPPDWPMLNRGSTNAAPPQKGGRVEEVAAARDFRDRLGHEGIDERGDPTMRPMLGAVKESKRPGINSATTEARPLPSRRSAV